MITLTLAAPGKNALGTELMSHIISTLKGGRDASGFGEPVFVVGAEGAFSAGLNLKEVASLDPPGMTKFLETLEEMVDVLYNYPGPTFAYVNGHAIAGGCVLALACDHRLVKNDSAIRIGVNEVPLGLQFPPKTWRMVKRRVPPRALERVVLEGALHSPAKALALGLVDELVESEEEARAYAARVCKADPGAYAVAKRGIREGVLDITAEEKRAFFEEAVPRWTSPALKAKLAAVLKK